MSAFKSLSKEIGKAVFTERTFHSTRISINYAEGPPNGEPIVMLHGVTNRWQSFLPVLPLFGGRYHTYALDHRGHGHSGRAADGYQSGQLSNDVIQFLQEIVRRPVVLIGHSLGAMIAARVAAEVPHLVKAAVLSDPPLSAAVDRDGAVPPWFSQYLDLVRSAATQQEKLSELAAIAQETDPFADGTTLNAQLRSLELVDPEVLVTGAEKRLFADFAVNTILPNICCPVLFLQGNPKLGGVVSEEEAQRALELIPHATHVQLTDMGHSLHIPQPSTFFSLVDNFIKRF